MIHLLRLGLAGALPLAAGCAVTAAVATRLAGRRLAVVAAAGVLGVFVAATTEALSLAHAVRPLPVAACWAVLTAVGTVVAHRWREDAPARPALDRPLDRPVAALLAFAALMTALVVAVAVLSPPNNFDSMAYHLPRVAQWAQNHTVAFFATNDPRQLYMPPWAEYAVLHLQVMAGSDQWDSLVQVAAMLVTAAATSLVAAHAGLTRVGQVATAALVLAIPIGVAEAPTTQTDYVLTMWVVCLLAVARVDLRGAVSPAHCAVFGGYLGLALLTKPTAWFFATPVVIFFVWRQLRARYAGRDLRAVPRDALVVTAVVITVTGVFFGRNVATFGDLFGDDTNVPATTSAPRTLVENSVRSIAVQLGTPVGAVNRATEQLTTGALRAIGLSIDDPATTKADQVFTVGFSTREDNAGSLAATVLGLVAAGWLLVRRPRPRALLLVTGMAMLGFVLRSLGQPFSPYLSRYLLTWFVLLAPATAALLLSLPRRLGGAVLALVCASSLLWAVAADLRPLAGSRWLHESGAPSLLTQARDDEYFAVRPELRGPYLAAAAHVRALAPHTVGLVSGPNAFEYPMWALLQRGSTTPQLRHLGARFEPGRRATGRPDLLVCLDACPAGVAGWDTGPARFGTRRDFGPVRVWSR